MSVNDKKYVNLTYFLSFCLEYTILFKMAYVFLAGYMSLIGQNVC